MVMPNRDAKLDGGAAGVGAAEGRRPTAVPTPAAATPELSDRPRRRTFTVQDKLRVLAEIDRAPAGGTGAILRREGLYSSTLSEWRRLREAGALGAMTSIKRGPKPAVRNPMAGELAQAKRENARLLRRLEHAEAIIAIQKKWQPCWVCRWRHQTATVVALAPTPGLTAGACAALNVSRASVYRQRMRLATLPAVRQPRPKPQRALAAVERQIVLDLLRAPRFADQAPAEIYACLLDEGVYHCSIRTMYRILVQSQEVRERRNQLRHPIYKKPELLAQAPNEVWSWDITKLMGPAKWSYFYLYVIIDIFSRRVVGWCVADRESATVFAALFDDATTKNPAPKGQLTLHADRGGPMRAKATALLLADLGVTKSHSRPHTSNDNPFSESHFKTMKYQPQFPQRFGCIQDAKTFCRSFFAWYNQDHHHAGIGLLTPDQVHYGQADEVHAARQITLDGAFSRNPERFVRKEPEPPAKPTATWINPPTSRQTVQA
jgi:putative transposase